jgi:uncharacterized membrane protein
MNATTIHALKMKNLLIFLMMMMMKWRRREKKREGEDLIEKLFGSFEYN